MTNEKILKALYAAGKQIKDFDVCMSIVNRENGIPKMPVDPEYDLIIAGLIYDLEKETREKGIKSAGKSDLLTAAKNILKSAKSDLGHKPDFQKPFTSGKYQCFCDGFRLLALSGDKKLEIETSDRELIKAENIIPTENCNCAVLPELVNLKLEIARFKSEYMTKHDKRIIVCFKDDKNNEIFSVNAEYLYDAIKATGAKNIYYKSGKSTLLFETDNVKFAVMPITGKNQHKTTAGTFHYIEVSPTGETCITTEIVEAEKVEIA